MGEVWELIREQFKKELKKDLTPQLGGRGLMVGITTDDGTVVQWERVQQVVVGAGSDTFLFARVLLVNHKPVLDIQPSFHIHVAPEEE